MIDIMQVLRKIQYFVFVVTFTRKVKVYIVFVEKYHKVHICILDKHH